MLTEDVENRLKANWGAKADAMDCFIEAKFIDPLSDWACYIYALNPDDDDEIACIIHDRELEICDWSMMELYRTFNREGEQPIVDQEFRRSKASTMYKKLREGR